MTQYFQNHGIATMIDPPNASQPRMIVAPTVRTNEDLVFLFVTLADDADTDPIPAFRLPAGSDLRPNDGMRRWR